MAPYVVVDVDYIVPTGTAADPAIVPGTLLFEPTYDRPLFDPALDKWQTWNPTIGEKQWWSPTPVPGVKNGVCKDVVNSPPFDAIFCTWGDITAVQGEAKIRDIGLAVGDLFDTGAVDTGAATGHNLSSTWHDFIGYADALKIGDGTTTTTYDFELADVGPSGHDAFALGTGTNQIWRFDLVNPLTAFAPTTVANFATPNETLVAIAFHPDGDLYGVTRDTTNFARVYRVYDAGAHEFDTGAATVAPFPLPGNGFGASFEPAANAAGHHTLHVVSDADLHVAIDIEAGAAVPLPPLAYSPVSPHGVVDPQVVGLAHAPGAGGLQLYGIDAGTRGLVQVAETAGPLAELGRFPNVTMDARASIDATASGATYGSFGRVGAVKAEFYEIDRAIPAARHVSKIQGPTVASGFALPRTGALAFDGDPDVTEDNTQVTVQVTRTGGDYGELIADVADVVGPGGGTATADGDYRFTDQRLRFEDGSAVSQPLTIDVLDDTIAGEGDETVVLELTDPRGEANFIASNRYTLTINDSEAGAVRFAAAAVSVNESVAAGKTTLTVQRDDGDGSATSVTITRVGGSATAGADYGAFNTTVNFPDVDGTPNSVAVDVPIINDTAFEGTEDVTFRLTNPTNDLTVGTPDSVTVTITDDPPGQVQFSPATYEVNEGSARTVTVTRTGGNEGDVVVRVFDVTAAVNPATRGGDYAQVLETRTFGGANNAATVSRTLDVQTHPDQDFEGDENIALALSVDTGGASVGVGSAQVTILDMRRGLAYALTGNNRLASFDPEDPSAASSGVPITGLAAGDQVRAIDFRPENQLLYAVTTGNNQTRVYTIDPQTAHADPVVRGSIKVGFVELCVPTPDAQTCPNVVDAPAVPGQAFAADWDASTDTLRFTSDLGLQLVFDPGPTAAWTWRPGGPLVYSPGEVGGALPDPGAGTVPKLAALAHEQNFDPRVTSAGPAATAYGIDPDHDTLVRLGSPQGAPLPADSGLVVTVGELGGDPTSPGDLTDANVGLDVTTDGRAYAVLTKAGASKLYRIDLGTGAAEEIGLIGTGATFTDVAFGPPGVIDLDVANQTITGEGGVALIEVRRVGGSYGKVQIDIGADPVTATAADYGVSPAVMTFDDGDTAPQTLSVSVTDDPVFEPDETFDLVLSNLQGGAVFASRNAELRRTQTIVDDPLGTVEYHATPFGANEDEGKATLSVKRVGGGEGPLSLDFVTEERVGAGAATKNDDYTHTSGKVSFPHGSKDLVLTFDVDLGVDPDEELNETFDVRISNAQPTPTPPVDATTTVTIRNDDNAGTLRFGGAEFLASEDAGEAIVTVARTGGADGAVSVDFRTNQQAGAHRATAGADYASVTRRVTLPDGVASVGVSVPVLDDATSPVLEGDETFEVELLNPTDLPGRANELDPAADTASVRLRDTEPGEVYAVVADTDTDGAQELVRVEVARPDVVVAVADITGLATGETVAAIDFRPGSDELYALALRDNVDSMAGRIYVLDPGTGQATLAGDVATAGGISYALGADIGIAFDPVRNELRTVDSTGTNLRLEIDPGTADPVVLHEDAPLFYPADTPTIVGSAYTAGPTTTLYGIDSGLDKLARQGDAGAPTSADSGELTQIGPLGANTGNQVGFDVDHFGRALATLSATDSALYEINLGSGAATHIGDVGGPDQLEVEAMAAPPPAGTLGFSVTELSTIEGTGDDTDHTYSVTVERTDGEFGEVSVKYDIVDAEGAPVSCEVGEIEVPASGTVEFAPNATTSTFDVCVRDDNVFREDTELKLRLFDPIGAAVLGTSQATLKVTDDDMPTVSVSDAEAFEGDNGETPNLAFTLSLSNPTAKDTTVKVSTTSTGDNPAVASEDFVSPVAEVTISKNETAAPTGTVKVTLLGDMTYEPHETFTLSIDEADNATLADAAAIGTIKNDDPIPEVSVVDADIPVGVTEGTGVVATIPVTLTNPSHEEIAIAYELLKGTATAPEDYDGTGGTVVFDKGTTQQTITVPINNDPYDEDPESFSVRLTPVPPGSAWSIGEADTAVVTITDDDPEPSLSVSDATVEEGDDGVTEAVFTVKLSPLSGKAVAFKASTEDGTAKTADADYTSLSAEPFTIPAGDPSVEVKAPVLGDTLDEINETFSLELFDPVNAGIVDGTGVGTINDNDAPPTVSVTGPEGLVDEGQGSAPFTVSLSGPSGKPVSVVAGAVPGDFAEEGSDFEAIVADLIFEPGKPTTKTVSVPLVDDNLDEFDDEDFFVVLSDLKNVDEGTLAASAVIADNDAPPSLSIGDASVVEGDSGETEMDFTVSLSAPSGKPIAVLAETVDGTATGDVDYVPAGGIAIFLPGDVAVTGSVAVVGDTVDEPDETFALELFDPINAGIADDTGIGTIRLRLRRQRPGARREQDPDQRRRRRRGLDSHWRRFLGARRGRRHLLGGRRRVLRLRAGTEAAGGPHR